MTYPHFKSCLFSPPCWAGTVPECSPLPPAFYHGTTEHSKREAAPLVPAIIAAFRAQGVLQVCFQTWIFLREGFENGPGACQGPHLDPKWRHPPPQEGLQVDLPPGEGAGAGLSLKRPDGGGGGSGTGGEGRQGSGQDGQTGPAGTQAGRRAGRAGQRAGWAALLTRRLRVRLMLVHVSGGLKTLAGRETMPREAARREAATGTRTTQAMGHLHHYYQQQPPAALSRRSLRKTGDGAPLLLLLLAASMSACKGEEHPPRNRFLHCQLCKWFWGVTQQPAGLAGSCQRAASRAGVGCGAGRQAGMRRRWQQLGTVLEAGSSCIPVGLPCPGKTSPQQLGEVAFVNSDFVLNMIYSDLKAKRNEIYHNCRNI